MPRIPKEWKPAPVICRYDETQEEHYKVLPKRNNACPPCYTPSSSVLMTGNNGASENEGIYMKVMADRDPPPYHGPHHLRLDASSNNLASRTNPYSDYDSVENLRQDYAFC